MHYRFLMEVLQLLASLSEVTVLTGHVRVGMLEAMTLKLLQKILAPVGNKTLSQTGFCTCPR